MVAEMKRMENRGLHNDVKSRSCILLNYIIKVFCCLLQLSFPLG